RNETTFAGNDLLLCHRLRLKRQYFERRKRERVFLPRHQGGRSRCAVLFPGAAHRESTTCLRWQRKRMAHVDRDALRPVARVAKCEDRLCWRPSRPPVDLELARIATHPMRVPEDFCIAP